MYKRAKNQWLRVEQCVIELSRSFLQVRLHFIPFVFFLTFTSVHANGENEEAGRELSETEIHAIAWPIARDYFNHEIASKEVNRGNPGFIESLAPNAFSRPSTIQRKGNVIWVGYGRPAGPSISVKMTLLGEVIEAKESYSNL